MPIPSAAHPPWLRSIAKRQYKAQGTSRCFAMKVLAADGVMGLIQQVGNAGAGPSRVDTLSVPADIFFRSWWFSFLLLFHEIHNHFSKFYDDCFLRKQFLIKRLNRNDILMMSPELMYKHCHHLLSRIMKNLYPLCRPIHLCLSRYPPGRYFSPCR